MADDRSPTCHPCRGTGRLVSNLGGEQHAVECAWCGGTGRFDPTRDAQDHPAERDVHKGWTEGQGAADSSR